MLLKRNLFFMATAFMLSLAWSIDTIAVVDREKFRQAMDECAEEVGVSRPGEGEPPTEEQFKQLDACLAEKGIEKPPRGRPHHKRPHRDNQSEESNEIE